MSGNEVYAIIESLAASQGFYGRLLARLNEVGEDVANEFLDSFADCKDIIDVIMLIEG
jgi:hypothetical protein